MIAPRSPGDCFDAAIEAARIALTYRTPVILLSDGYLANGAEPWAVPSVDDLPDLPRSTSRPSRTGRRTASSCPTCGTRRRSARPWAIPGTAGMQHRVGGLEKADRTGNISYDPANHDFMTRTRQAKIDGIAATLPPTEVDDPDGDARVASSAGGRPTGRSAPPAGGSGARAGRSRRSTCATSTRCPADLGEVLRAVRPGGLPRDEPRPARRCCCARSTWSTWRATPRCAGCRSGPPSWRPSSRTPSTHHGGARR